MSVELDFSNIQFLSANHRSRVLLFMRSGIHKRDIVDIKQTLIEVIIALKASEKDINTTIPLLVCQFEYLIFMVKTSSLPDAT